MTLIAAAWLVAFPVFAIAAWLDTSAVSWIGVGALALVAVYIVTIRCPECGTSVTRRTVHVGGEEFVYWGFPGRQCSRCGHRLDGAVEEPGTHSSR